MSRRARGVGLQFNPTIAREIGPAAFQGARIDFAELLCDMFAAPLDCGYVLDPAMRPELERLGADYPLVAHGNYGGEFGFEPLSECAGVLRHVEIAREMNSPWYADHMFYGEHAHSYMWSSPLQFSRAEAKRVAERAAALQDKLGLPLLHENAFYYAPFPGADVTEAEFMAEVVERAGTRLLLDLHNIHANSVNFPDFDPWRYLRTIPLDKVVEIHLAGGQQLEGFYHDLHNHSVPEPVWKMLEHVLSRAPRLEAVTLEFQGLAHTAGSRPVDGSWVPMIVGDLDRARALWDAAGKGARP